MGFEVFPLFSLEAIPVNLQNSVALWALGSIH